MTIEIIDLCHTWVSIKYLTENDCIPANQSEQLFLGTNIFYQQGNKNNNLGIYHSFCLGIFFLTKLLETFGDQLILLFFEWIDFCRKHFVG